MTRVTNLMMSTMLLRNLSSNLSDLEKTNEDLSTLTKIRRPSDDPTGLSKLMRIKAGRNSIDQYSKNVQTAKTWLDVTDTALDQVDKIILRAQELATQASSETYDASQRKSISDEIDQLRNQLIDVANSSYEGKYIFGGFQTSTPPYTKDSVTGKVLYSGDNGKITAEIGQGVMMDYNISDNRAFILAGTSTAVASTGSLSISPASASWAGASVKVRVSGVDASGNVIKVQADFGNGFGTDIAVTPPAPPATSVSLSIGNSMTATFPSAGSVGDTFQYTVDGAGAAAGAPTLTQETDMFTSLANFSAALNANNTSGVQNAAGELERSLNNVLWQRAEVGAKTNRLEFTSSRLTENSDTLEGIQAEIEDVDTSEAIVRLKNQENTYQAILAVGAKIIQPSLVDFLK